MLARFGLLAFAPLLVAAVFVTPQLVTPTYAEQAATSESQPAAIMDFLFAPQPDSSGDESDDGATDVYGNEVTVAVAKYRLDATGAQYELHSPQTELPRLAPPKS
jgi:hypothetical protein